MRTLLQDPESRKILENWFYAAQYYNGGSAAEQYRDLIYDHVLHPADRIAGSFPPVAITRPEAAIPNFAAGQVFCAAKNGTWTDGNCGTHPRGAASVHLSGSFAKPYAHQFANISTRVSVGTGNNVLIAGFIIDGAQSKKILLRANNGSGIGLVEVYDLNTSASARLANISTRGRVQNGDNVMIGGLIVTGRGSQKMLLRALGPSLSLPGALTDPMVELHDGNGTIIVANDNWKTEQQSAIEATQLAPTKDAESAILTTQPPGSYTAVLRGANGATGIALVEAYPLN